MKSSPARGSPREVLYQRGGGGAENVVVGDAPALLGLDPLRPQPVLPAPFLEHGPQPDDVKERPLAHEAANRRPVIVVEVAVDRHPARLGEGDRLFDLAALEIGLAQAEPLRHAFDVTRACAQMGRYAHSAQGRSSCSGPSSKSPVLMRSEAARILRSTRAASGATSWATPRRRSKSTSPTSRVPGRSPRAAAMA